MLTVSANKDVKVKDKKKYKIQNNFFLELFITINIIYKIKKLLNRLQMIAILAISIFILIIFLLNKITFGRFD